MSQYPNDLSGGGGVMLRGNRLGLSTDTGGIRENIGVQGLEPLPVDTSGMQVANELAQSLGLFAQLGGTIDQVQRRKQAAQAQEDAKVEQFDRGAAVRAAANTYAELEPAIRERKMIAAVDDKDLGSYVENLIQSRTDKGMAPAWKDEYNKQLHGRLLNAFGQQRAGIQKDAKETALQSLKDAATGARTTVEIMQSVMAAKDTLGFSEMEAQAAITVPSLRLAAKQGDTDKFEQASFALQGMFADEVEKGKTELNATVQRNGLDRQRANEQEFSAWFNADPQNLPPIEVAFDRLDKTDMTPADRDQWRRALEAEQSKAISRERQTIEDMVGAKLFAGEPEAARKTIESGRAKLGDEWANSKMGQVQSYQNQVLDIQSKQAEAQWESSLVGDAVNLMSQAYLYGDTSLTSVPDELTVKLPNGKEAKRSKKEVLAAAQQQMFAGLDERFKDNPAAAFPEKLRLISATGVEPANWKATLSTATMATEDALSDPERARPVLAGFSLYRAIYAQNPALANQMTDPKSRELYDMTEGMLASTRTVGADGKVATVNLALAMLSASKMIADPEFNANKAQADEKMNRKEFRGSERSLLDSAVDELSQGGLGGNDIRSDIRREARALVIGGTPPDVAIKEVVKRHKTTAIVVGGKNNRRVINTQYEGFSDQFRRDLPERADALIAKYAKEQGVPMDDLSFKFDGSTFRIVDRTEKMVPHPKDIREVIFDLDRFAKAGDRASKDEILRKWRGKDRGFKDPGAEAFLRDPGLIQ